MAEQNELLSDDPAYDTLSVLPLAIKRGAPGGLAGSIPHLLFGTPQGGNVEWAIPQSVRSQVNALWDIVTTPGNVMMGRENPSAATSARLTGDFLRDASLLKPALPENELGVFVRGWHGTTAEFGDEYLPGQGIGPHFGNVEQAHSRAGAGFTTTPGDSPVEQLSWLARGTNVRPANIDINNPIRLQDMDQSKSGWRSMSPWEHPEFLARQLYEKGLMSKAESETIGARMQFYSDRSDTQSGWEDYMAEKQKWISYVRNRLINRGHDAIVYHNTFEGSGDSVVPLLYDKGQITPGFGKSHAIELEPHTHDLERKIARYSLEPIEHDPFAVP